ncbi:MAG: TonB-dependent receptor, partial [Flavobacteriales bacterium]|nr:TonB-dependent receptor [Flavobacteriales bacterium]
MLRFSLLLSLILTAAVGFSQTVTVSGEVRNEEDALLEGVRVFEKENKGNGTVTNEFGRFFIQLAIDKTTTLVFEYFGSTPTERTITPSAGGNKELRIVITTDHSLPGVQVTGDGRERGMKPIETKLLVSLPSVSGNIEDYLRTTVVNIASELSSSYSVRGGSFDENLVYVNDIQVYRPFLVRAGEQEGLSFPNADMVDRIEFSAGGFAARYGDKMSSVLDIRYRKPNSFGGSAMASLLGGSLHLEGISKDERWTLNSGVRYKSNTYILNTLDTQGDYDPRFVDFQTYVTFSPKPYGPLEFALLGNYARNKYQFIPGTRQTDVGTINEALRLTVFFEGQEVTQFETLFGAFSTRYQPSEKTSLKFIVSAFNTAESEHFDVLGAYSLDELERDLGSDSFGEVLGNRGVGAFLNHGRNDLQANVLNFTHKGITEIPQSHHTLEWGAEAIVENIFDELSEWTVIDSAGYASTHPTDSLGYQVPSLQPDQLIPFQDVVRG